MSKYSHFSLETYRMGAIFATGLLLVAGVAFLFTFADLLPVFVAAVLGATLIAAAFYRPPTICLLVIATFILVPVDLSVQFAGMPRLGPTRVLIAAFLTGLGLRWILRPDRTRIRPPLAGPVLLFAATAAVSLLLSFAPLRSTFTLGSLILEQFLIFLAFHYLLQDPEFWEKAKKVLFFSTAFVCLFAGYEFMTQSNPLLPFFEGESLIFRAGLLRVRSVFFHPIALACFLTFIFPLVLAELNGKKPLHAKSLPLFLLLAIPTTLTLTVSRGPFLVLVITAGLFLLAWTWKNTSRKVLALSLFAVLLCVLAFAVQYQTRSGEFLARFFNPHGTTVRYMDEESSAYYRIALGRAIVSELQGVRWITGFGPGTFQLAELESRWAGDDHILTAPDSEYLRMLFEFGLLGLGAFIVLLTAASTSALKAVRSSSPEERLTALACCAAIIGFVFENITVSMFRVVPLAGLFWLFTAKSIHLSAQALRTTNAGNPEFAGPREP